MNKFKVGTNFDSKLLDDIIALNKMQTKNKITELYGSIKSDAETAARPAFRLPSVTDDDMIDYIKKAKRNLIDFNYTMNSIMPYGNKRVLLRHKHDIIETLHGLEIAGVKRLTVANPILLEILKEANMLDVFKIEISTVAHIDTVTQIKYYHEMYGVDKVCGNLLKNRDFAFLEAAANYCNANEMAYEVMVNEFCGVGGENYATHCVYRDSCYLCHAVNKTKMAASEFNNYPMNLCMASRDMNPSNWLKLRFIRPEDIKFYNDIGITNFKITGRTGSSEYIIRTLSAYLNESFEGNLINLWKPLESILDESKESNATHSIPNKSLDGFIDIWVKDKKQCDLEVCGQTCNYCERFYKKVIE